MLSPYQGTEMVWRARERWAWSTQQQSTAGALGSQGLPDGLFAGLAQSGQGWETRLPQVLCPRGSCWEQH